MLALLALAVILGMSVWMTANPVSESLAGIWNLDKSGKGWLVSAVQIGFVAGAASLAVSNLADLVSGKRLFVISAIAAAMANAFLLNAGGFREALVSRFFTGFFLAGMYPPAMKMISTWFVGKRGLAIGTIVGALVLGKGLPWLLKLFFSGDWKLVVISSSVASLGGATLVAAGWRDGPFRFESRPFSWTLVAEVLRNRKCRLVTFGYLGHMWELYAFWTWAPVFLSYAARQSGVAQSSADLLSFAVIAAGSAGCVIGGQLADRFGRRGWVIVSLAGSGFCCLVAGATAGLPFPLVGLLAAVWGFFVVADSAQFSAMVTTVSQPHSVGTALAIQTSLGFLLTTVSIQLLPAIEKTAGWWPALAMLAIGPVFGIVAMRQLGKES